MTWYVICEDSDPVLIFADEHRAAHLARVWNTKYIPVEPIDQDGDWFVVVRKDNFYPLLVYADRNKAMEVASKEGCFFVQVRRLTEEAKE